MSEESLNALQQLTKKRQAQTHRVLLTGQMVGEGEAAAVQVLIPRKELEAAREGTGQRRSYGFALTVDFVLPEGTPVQLTAQWIAMKAR